MLISELQSYTEPELAELDTLIRTLAPDSRCRREQLERVLHAPDAHLYVVRDGEHIIGCATLCILPTAEMTVGAIEAVVVSPDYRGQHLGRRLVEHMIAQARTLGADSLHLTSNPSRIAANALYRALGFRLKETNCYVLPLGQD